MKTAANSLKDALTNGKSETHAFAGGLRGEERVGRLRKHFRRHAVPLVSYLEADLSANDLSGDRIRACQKRLERFHRPRS